MFIVLFDVRPHPERWDDYLATAALLRPELLAVDGFVDNVRYAAAQAPSRILSLSTWRDEKSLVRWRAHAVHHEQGQRRGRFEVFADYRLRVAEVTDTCPPPDIEVCQQRYDETEVGGAKAVTVVEPLDPVAPAALPAPEQAPELVDAERYDGVLEPHAPLLLSTWRTLAAARAGTGPRPGVRVRHARVIREYGMTDRREAPQYMPG